MLVSLILFEYFPIKALQLGDQLGLDTTSLWLEIFAILILYFVVFCIIWSLPTQRQKQRQEKHKEKEVGFETDKVATFSTDKASAQPFKEKNVDEMIENGYVLNVETGKWEKQIKPVKKPTYFWFLVPFFFGIIGGIIGYVWTKDEDNGFATGLLVYGLVWTICLVIIWLLFI